MILNRDRRLVMWLLRLKIWHVEMGFWRVPELVRRRGTGWIYRRMCRRQVRDDRHHAPCCPANHWHYQRLVFQYCNCGHPVVQIPEAESEPSYSLSWYFWKFVHNLVIHPLLALPWEPRIVQRAHDWTAKRCVGGG